MYILIPIPYPIEKVKDFPYSYPYPYPYPVNVGIFRQNGNEFGQYTWRRVYLSSLSVMMIKNTIKYNIVFSKDHEAIVIKIL